MNSRAMNICSMCITDFQKAFGKCTWFLKIITVVICRGKKLGFLVPLRGRPTPTKMHLVRLLDDACSLRYIFKQSIQKWNVTKKSTHWSSSAQIASFFPQKVAAFGCSLGCLGGESILFCLVFFHPSFPLNAKKILIKMEGKSFFEIDKAKNE